MSPHNESEETTRKGSMAVATVCCGVICALLVVPPVLRVLFRKGPGNGSSVL